MAKRNEMDVDVFIKDMWNGFKNRRPLGKLVWILFTLGLIYAIISYNKFGEFNYILIALPLAFWLDWLVGRK